MDLTLEELKAKVENNEIEYIRPFAHALRKEGHYFEAYQNYIKSIRYGHPYSARYICEMCYSGDLDQYLTKEEQFNWLLRFYDTCGVDYYTYILAKWYKDGIGVKKDINKYIHYLTLCAEDGSSNATIELAKCYEDGFGVDKSYEKAFKLYDEYHDEHGKPDMYCLYKVAYYHYYELAGKTRDLAYIKKLLLYAGKYDLEAKAFYIEIFKEDFPKQ